MNLKSFLKLPLSLLLAAVVLGLAPAFFSLPERWDKFSSLSAKLLAVIAFAVFVQKILLALHQRYISGQESLKTYSGLIRVLISAGVYGLFLLIFLDTAGVSITPLVASLGVGSVAVALALQDTLASLFSGLYLVADKPVRVGDFVKLETGDEGSVETIGWRSVRIRTIRDIVIVVPNAKLAGSIIINYSLPHQELSVPVAVGVDYTSDLEKVERVTLEVAREVMKGVVGGMPGFEPMVRYQGFGDSSINFNVILRAKEFSAQALIVHEFIKRLHRRYQQEGVSIPFPTRTLFLHKD